MSVNEYAFLVAVTHSVVAYVFYNLGYRRRINESWARAMQLVKDAMNGRD